MVRCDRWAASVMHLLTGLVVFCFALGLGVTPASAQKPKVRTVTAFIRLDPAQYQQQIAETVAMLRNAKARFDLAGYTVETIRIATQPFPEYTAAMSNPDAMALFHNLDELAKKENFTLSIGPALLTENDNPAQVQLLAQILGATTSTFGSIVVTGPEGVHWKAVQSAAGVMKYLEDHTDHGLGNFRFAAIANVPAYTPFFPGSYHQGLGHQFAIAMESANVVAGALAVTRDIEATRQDLISQLGMHARAVADIAGMIDHDTGWSYMGVDLSPAPLKEVSIGSATAGLTGGRFGTSGTLTAAATITSALADIAVKKVGFNGMMMPVLEDTRLSQLWGEGALSLDQLMAYSSVCGTGLDMIALPGEVTIDQLARIIGDVATLSVKLSKPLTTRLLPVAGGKPGDQTSFDNPHIVNTVLQPLP